MKIDEAKGYNIKVDLHGDGTSFFRECIIHTTMEPAEVQALFDYAGTVALTNTVKAIKYVRQELNCSLREAKDFVMDSKHEKRIAALEVGTIELVQPFGVLPGLEDAYKDKDVAPFGSLDGLEDAYADVNPDPF